MRFHVVKRDGCPLWKKLGLYVLAVLAALRVNRPVKAKLTKYELEKMFKRA